MTFVRRPAATRAPARPPLLMKSRPNGSQAGKSPFGGPGGSRGAPGPPGPPGLVLTGVIFVEKFLSNANGDIRTAAIAAFQSDLTTPGVTFKFPAGVFNWPSASPITFAEGMRNNITLDFTGCEITKDMAGVASNAIYFFFHNTGVDLTHDIHIIGGKFSLLNCLTSFFGMAIQFGSTADCSCVGSEFYCTLDPAAVTGRIRWGLGFFGGTTSNGGGRNNRVTDVKVTCSQIQLCGQGCDANGIVCENITAVSCNDFAVSCVTSGDGGCSLRNVRISGINARDITGTGVLFVGNDGATAEVTPTVVMENILIENIQLDGSDDFALSFPFSYAVLFAGGAITRNIQIRGVNVNFSSAAAQARGVVVLSHPSETLFEGLALSDMNLGVATTNDPLEALYVGGKLMTQVSITNVHVKGQRGIFVSNCDNLVLNNVTTQDGTLTVRADRHLGAIEISNVALARGSGFNPGLFFTSPSGWNFTDVQISSSSLQGHSNPALLTSLSGGTMSMNLTGVRNRNPSDALDAQTKTGIIRATGCPGITIPTTVSVTVPPVAAGGVGYVIVDMAGTRLADLVVGEGVVAVPSAQLVAAGAGGAYANARVSSTGHVELAFVGALAGGVVNFNFYRA